MCNELYSGLSDDQEDDDDKSDVLEEEGYLRTEQNNETEYICNAKTDEKMSCKGNEMCTKNDIISRNMDHETFCPETETDKT